MTFPPDLRTHVDTQHWAFAKTMPEWPDEYIVRDGVDEELFERLVVHIRKHGRKGRFYEKTLIYYEEANLVYWTMGEPLSETTIVNRCRREDTYEARLARDDLPASPPTACRRLADETPRHCRACLSMGRSRGCSEPVGVQVP